MQTPSASVLERKYVAAPKASMRPPGKARRGRIPGVFNRGATLPGGMQRRLNAGVFAFQCTSVAWMLTFVIALISSAVRADNATPYPGTVVIKTPHNYGALVQRLVGAIKKHKMGLVARASATMGAKSLGITIPGNQVLMVYHPKFAVRMLKASVPAGIEAPIRYYVTEEKDGTATLTYRTPSSVFNPYENTEIDAMAKELDVIFDNIAKDAVGP